MQKTSDHVQDIVYYNYVYNTQ